MTKPTPAQRAAIEKYIRAAIDDTWAYYAWANVMDDDLPALERANEHAQHAADEDKLHLRALAKLYPPRRPSTISSRLIDVLQDEFGCELESYPADQHERVIRALHSRISPRAKRPTRIYMDVTGTTVIDGDHDCKQFGCHYHAGNMFNLYDGGDLVGSRD
jgi:hypothetical protein